MLLLARTTQKDAVVKRTDGLSVFIDQDDDESCGH
jgi:hypothetical protein